MANPNSLSRRTTLRLSHRSIVTGLIILGYIVACCCPALSFDKYYPGDNAPQSGESWFGWTALLLGWLGILVGSVAWLANFVLGLTLIFLICGLRWATLVSSAVTVLLSLDFFPLFWANIPADEGGVGRAVLRPPDIGVWLWFASIAAGFAGAWLLFLAPRTEPQLDEKKTPQPQINPD
jgi:hypothetical protein